jgi:hypothetical protein
MKHEINEANERYAFMLNVLNHDEANEGLKELISDKEDMRGGRNINSAEEQLQDKRDLFTVYVRNDI